MSKYTDEQISQTCKSYLSAMLEQLFPEGTKGALIFIKPAKDENDKPTSYIYENMSIFDLQAIVNDVARQQVTKQAVKPTLKLVKKEEKNDKPS